jgi:hypothetical protein
MKGSKRLVVEKKFDKSIQFSAFVSYMIMTVGPENSHYSDNASQRNETPNQSHTSYAREDRVSQREDRQPS